MSSSKVKPKYTMPPNKLKAKVGGGGIPPDRREKAQEYIENNQFDFLPYAQNFIENVESYIAKAKTAKTEPDRNELIKPVMHLKANGGMFKYQLISDIADICLTFVEAVDEMNDDAYQVVQAHIAAISVIAQNKMSGKGGQEGKALTKELNSACNRFFSKYKPKLPL